MLLLSNLLEAVSFTNSPSTAIKTRRRGLNWDNNQHETKYSLVIELSNTSLKLSSHIWNIIYFKNIRSWGFGVLFGSDHELHEEHKNAYLNLLTNFRLGCKICMYWHNTVDHCLWFRNVLSEIKWGIIYIKQIIAMPGGQHCKYDYSFIKTMSHLFSDRHVWTTTVCVAMVHKYFAT